MVLLLALALAGVQKPSCCSDMAQFANDPAFVAAHVAPVRIAFQPKNGKMVSFPAGDTPTAAGVPGHGYLVPAKKGNRAAILMFHEWWGLNDQIKREAERLHNELGAAVLAVDLYDGKVTADPAQAGKLMQSIDDNRAKQLVWGAINALEGKIAHAKVLGTIGWCFGGGWSHRAAIEGGSDVKACVIYYGSPSTDPVDLKRLKAPVLMFWGTQDGFINANVVSRFEQAMKKAGKPLKTHSFNAVHAFANPSNPKYDKAAAATSHAETLAFFRKYLK